MSKHNNTADKHETNSVLPLVFYIRGMCGVILNVHYTQAAAIKEYILMYKNKVAGASLVEVRDGKQYVMTPSGSVMDYR